MSEINPVKVFVSSTYEDLELTRRLVNKLLLNDFSTCVVELECESEEIQAERTKEALDSATSCLLLFGPSGKPPWGTEAVLLMIDEWEARSDESYRVIPVSLPGGPDALPLDLLNTESLRRLRQSPGAFVKFEEDLDEEEATHKLILLLRGVNPDEQPLWAQDEFRHYINRRARNAFDVNWSRFATEARSVFLHTGEQGPRGHLTSEELAAELTWLSLLSDETMYTSRLAVDIANGEGSQQPDCSASFEDNPESLKRPLSEVLACHESTEEMLSHPEFMRRGRLICRTLLLNRPDAKDLYVDAEDLYQEVCFKIWHSARNSSRVYGMGDVGNFFRWFRQVARNTLLDTSRKQGAARCVPSFNSEDAAREQPMHILGVGGCGHSVLHEVYETLLDEAHPTPRRLPHAPPRRAPQAFISYARQDELKVEGLYSWLQASGFTPWMDKRDVHAGQQWKPVIEEAIRESDFLLVCLSENSAGKSGALGAEIREALEVWQEKSLSDTYVIPVLLEECHLPQRFSHLRQVELFEEGGWSQLSTALREWSALEERALPAATNPLRQPSPCWRFAPQGNVTTGQNLWADLAVAFFSVMDGTHRQSSVKCWDELESLYREESEMWELLDKVAGRVALTLGTRLEPIVQIIPHTPVPLVIGFENIALAGLGGSFPQLCDEVTYLEPGHMLLLETLADLRRALNLWDGADQKIYPEMKQLLFTIKLEPEVFDGCHIGNFLKTYLHCSEENIIFEVNEKLASLYLCELKKLQADRKWRFCADDFDRWTPEAKAALGDCVEMTKVTRKTFLYAMEIRDYDPEAAINLIAAHRIADRPLVVEGIDDPRYLQFLREHWPSEKYGRLCGQGRLFELELRWSDWVRDIRDFYLKRSALHILTDHE